MTGQELFNYACGIMGISASNATSYEETILPQINFILSQCLELENNNRRYYNLTATVPLDILTSAPALTALSETINYQANVLKNVVAMGICQLMKMSDDETIQANFYEVRYIDGMKAESKYINDDIEDYFGTGEDEE